MGTAGYLRFDLNAYFTPNDLQNLHRKGYVEGVPVEGKKTPARSTKCNKAESLQTSNLKAASSSLQKNRKSPRLKDANVCRRILFDFNISQSLFFQAEGKDFDLVGFIVYLEKDSEISAVSFGEDRICFRPVKDSKNLADNHWVLYKRLVNVTGDILWGRMDDVPKKYTFFRSEKEIEEAFTLSQDRKSHGQTPFISSLIYKRRDFTGFCFKDYLFLSVYSSSSAAFHYLALKPYLVGNDESEKMESDPDEKMDSASEDSNDAAGLDSVSYFLY